MAAPWWQKGKGNDGGKEDKNKNIGKGSDKAAGGWGGKWESTKRLSGGSEKGEKVALKGAGRKWKVDVAG